MTDGGGEEIDTDAVQTKKGAGREEGWE